MCKTVRLHRAIVDLNQSLFIQTLQLRDMIALTALAASAVMFVPAHAGIVDDIIFSKCSAAMNKEFKKAGKQLLLSHKNATCNCLVKEMKNHKSVEQAKEFCTK